MCAVARTLVPLLALAAPAAAQIELPSPLVPIAPGPVAGSIDLEVDPALVGSLAAEDEVVLRDFSLADGRGVDLVLGRAPFDFAGVGVFVDGARADWDAGDMTLWQGSVRGVPVSEVFLALSSRGCYGWVYDGLEYTHLAARPGASGDWSAPGARVFDDRALMAVPGGRASAVWCGADALTAGRGRDAVLGGRTYTPGKTLECKVAVETDYQLYQVWNDLAAEQSYLIALLGAVSARYFTQVDVVLSFPYVMFYTSSSDPWSTPDIPGSAYDMLLEFQGAWANNIPAGAHLAHFVSGANLGGGYAFIDVLCDPANAFAVSGNVTGGVTFPVQQGSNNWDFVVLAHETGHNFGAQHTHWYCPPLDECGPNCNGVTNCTSQGTVMSYCHLCTGGMSNITTYFHPTIAGIMRAEADASCLPDWIKSPLLTAYNFEGGNMPDWTTSDPGRVKVTTNAAFNGTYGVRMKKGGVGTPACTVGSTANQSWMASPLINTVGYGAIEVRVQLRCTKYETPCENVTIEWRAGGAWQPVAKYDGSAWSQLVTALPPGAANVSNLQIRLIANAKGKQERVDIDDFQVWGN